MAYLPIGTTANPAVVNIDGANVDAFTRVRVSQPASLFESKFLADNQPLFWDDAVLSGAGTSSTYNSNQSSVTLAVTASTAGSRARQTFQRFPYQPGNSQLILFTGILGTPASGITRRYGYFDDNNGLFFETNATDVRVVRRTSTSGSVVDNAVAQSSWNIDKMDGSGGATNPSGITVDWTKTQIFVIQLQWLGVGAVMMGLDINGNIYPVHKFYNANSLTVVYMSTPNLPMRVEITNSGTGGAASITHICTSVMTEGGPAEAGVQRALVRDTSLTTHNNASYYPLMAIRLKSGYMGARIDLREISVVAQTTSVFAWKLILNPTVTGTALSYTSLTNSAIEYDISRTNATTVSAGTEVAAGLGNNNTQSLQNGTTPGFVRLGQSIAGTMDVLVLAVSRITGATIDFNGSLTWTEDH